MVIINSLSDKLRLKKEQNKTKMHGANKYTCIAPVYNTEPYLDDFFLSFTNQLLDFENNINLIIVDGGSTDNSKAIVQEWQAKYPNNIKYIASETKFVSEARNIGLKYVETEWVTFTDSDDFIDPSYYLEVDNLLSQYNSTENKDSQIQVVITYLTNYIEDLPFVQRFKDEYPLRINYTETDPISLDKANHIPQIFVHNVFYRYSIINNNGLKFENIKMYEDAIFNIHYRNSIQTGNALYTKKAVTYYRLRQLQDSITNKFELDVEKYIETIRLYIYYLNEIQVKNRFIPDFAFSNYVFILQWYIVKLYNCKYPDILNSNRLDEYLNILKQLIDYIPQVKFEDMQYNIVGYEAKHVVAILSYFKNVDPEKYIVNLEKYDKENCKLLLTYHSRHPSEEFYVGDRVITPEKIVDCKDILAKTPCSIQRKIQLSFSESKLPLEIKIKNNAALIHIDGKYYSELFLSQLIEK